MNGRRSAKLFFFFMKLFREHLAGKSIRQGRNKNEVFACFARSTSELTLNVQFCDNSKILKALVVSNSRIFYRENFGRIYL